jgi:hypothetical protein
MGAFDRDGSKSVRVSRRSCVYNIQMKGFERLGKVVVAIQNLATLYFSIRERVLPPLHLRITSR